VAGSLAGLILGLVIAVATEFFGMSITAPEHIARTSLPVLEVIPVIRTGADRAIRKKRMVMAAASGMITALAACAILFYHFRSQIF
jgi:hypothetical protein